MRYPQPALLSLFATVALTLAACLPAPNLPKVQDNEAQLATIVAATLQAQPSPEQAEVGPTPSETPIPLLPRSVYFLMAAEGLSQVWRLAPDGHTLEQMTFEPVGVNAFDVSGVDGRLAYVSDNRLLLLGYGDNAARVLVDASDTDPQEPGYYYRSIISAPRFSPDGLELAFALDGIQLIDLASGEITHPLTNRLQETELGLTIPEELYFPEAWSPDGSLLLISIGFQESGTLAILDVATDTVTELQSSGVMCCHPSWAPDASSILVASPYLGIVSSGLWRYDAASGAETVLIPGAPDESTYQFVGWPLQLDSGELRYFYATSSDFTLDDIPLQMVASAADGASPHSPLRGDTLAIREALWAEDGSLTLIVGASQGGYGPLILLSADDRPAQTLANEARDLRWGP